MKMNCCITSFVILVAAAFVVHVAGIPTAPTVTVETSTVSTAATNSNDECVPHRHHRKRAPRLTLPNEWLRLGIRNESVIYTTPGSSFELVCEGTGSPPPTIKWYHGETLVSPEAGYPEKNDIGNIPLGRLTSRLRFGCITHKDQGAYYCTARTGSKVRSTSPVIIVVLEGNDTDKLPVTPKSVIEPTCKPDAIIPPRIMVWGPTLLEFIDEDAILPCIAFGNPTPKTRWEDHDGNPISTELDSPRFKRLSNGELFISKIAWSDMGMYSCIAENEHGSDRAETFLYPAKKSD